MKATHFFLTDENTHVHKKHEYQANIDYTYTLPLVANHSINKGELIQLSNLICPLWSLVGVLYILQKLIILNFPLQFNFRVSNSRRKQKKNTFVK